MGEMQNKVCVITGGAGSIGLASARQMYEAGAKIMLVDLRHENLTAAKASFEDQDRVATCQADVSDTVQTQNYISETTDKWGKIDVLFANAGFSGTSAPVTNYPDEIFDKVMAVNVRGTFLACKNALPEMNDGGSIIITSSIMGVTARPGSIAYIVSKHAVIGLMRGVAKEAAPRNIRVNVLAPGPTDNAFQLEIEERASKASGTNVTEMLNNWISLGRHADENEIANMAYFLASDKSSFSTGSVFMADGGMHI
ncbi:MAG: SDR family oxidoreductase [Rhodospirillaceae bacterium]|nr:SDR family oxidoreductase [Rhodospirillaceae bacterium]MBT4588521.1 SDR family oxidoreductase [Rhodospirillaceae bacterium]MBT4941209.1 SDR family oxidoreductase [Rhodospirillaceae bacterium]MBT5938539.1 SDR family oxidoreductase [Rhodospirillaceae bacterium]MBT7268161.1 SDR family oxidoreductase [Rhodospirillaceae bacterium]